MPWWHISHKEMKGEERFVPDLDGVDPDKWTVTRLPRRPTDADKFIDGKLCRDKELQRTLGTNREQNERIVPSPRELLELVSALTERVERLEQGLSSQPK